MTIDRAAEFRASRFAQIANITERVAELEAAVERGELRKISGGRYQVTGQGNMAWDRGEILSDQGMPEHGLDLKENGEAAFYSANARPWHGLGTHLEEGLFSAKAAAMASGQDWKIEKRRARFLWDENEDGTAEVTEENPLITGDEDMFLTVRSDTKAALGMVGKIWTSIHNVEAFTFMEEFGEPFETMGSFRGGRRVFASMALPNLDMTLEVNGVRETIKMYLLAINHHDGNGGLKVILSPYRIECGNTERLAVANAVTSWTIKHTKNHQDRIDEAVKALRLASKYGVQWLKEETALAQTDITDREIAAVIADVWPTKDEDGKVAQRNAEARVLDIMERWAVERERCGSTAYALERALTGHVDHGGSRRPRGDLKAASPLAVLGAAILEDTGATVKNAAHARVMKLVRR